MPRLTSHFPLLWALLPSATVACLDRTAPPSDTLVPGPSIVGGAISGPVATIDAPSRARRGVETRLSGEQSTDPLGGDLTYAWTCSDGQTDDSAEFWVTFGETGTETCTLEVITDTERSDIAVAEIEVHEDDAIWTILVFVNGDNDLEAAGLDDVNEMEQVGSTADVNIVVQFDRSPGHSTSDENWSGARRYYVEADDDTTSIG